MKVNAKMCNYVLTDGCGVDYRQCMIGQTLSLTETAALIGYSRRQLYNKVADGTFPVAPIRGSHPRRWSRADVDAWIAGNYPSQQEG